MWKIVHLVWYHSFGMFAKFSEKQTFLLLIHICTCAYPAGIYLLKVNNRKLEQGVKYVQN